MYPKVNQNISIEVNGQDKPLKSIVADIRDNEILIGVPMDLSYIGLLQVGTTIEVSYTLDVTKYKFFTEIIGRRNENIPLFILRKPEEKEILKIQMREDFRVNVNLSLALKEIEAKTINLSAGGLLFSCSSDLELVEGEVVSGTLFLSNFINKETEPVSFQCEIIRVDFIKEIDRSHVAVKFIELDLQDQKRIIQYCIEKQRQFRLKVR